MYSINFDKYRLKRTDVFFYPNYMKRYFVCFYRNGTMTEKRKKIYVDNANQNNCEHPKGKI